MDLGARALLQFEMARHEVSVHVRQQHVLDAQTKSRGPLDVLIDVAARIDDHSNARGLVAEQVGSLREAREIQLLEDHG